MNAPDTLKLHQLYQLSLKDLNGKCPDFANHAIVYLFEERASLQRELDRALREKSVLAFEQDITQTRLKNLIDKSEKMVDRVQTLINIKEK